jgi:hypothetical protein
MSRKTKRRVFFSFLFLGAAVAVADNELPELPEFDMDPVFYSTEFNVQNLNQCLGKSVFPESLFKIRTEGDLTNCQVGSFSTAGYRTTQLLFLQTEENMDGCAQQKGSQQTKVLGLEMLHGKSVINVQAPLGSKSWSSEKDCLAAVQTIKDYFGTDHIRCPNPNEGQRKGCAFSKDFLSSCWPVKLASRCDGKTQYIQATYSIPRSELSRLRVPDWLAKDVKPYASINAKVNENPDEWWSALINTTPAKPLAPAPTENTSTPEGSTH